MLPLTPKLSRRSGSSKAIRAEGLRGAASAATTFINLNKYSTYSKNFFVLCGIAGNKVNALSIGNRKNKKTRRHSASVASVFLSLELK